MLGRLLFNQDNSFKILLEKEFLRDFRFCKALLSIPEDKRDNLWEKCIDIMKEKYFKDNCESFLYSFVSKQLQEQYWYIHKTIQRMLINVY